MFYIYMNVYHVEEPGEDTSIVITKMIRVIANIDYALIMCQVLI